MVKLVRKLFGIGSSSETEVLFEQKCWMKVIVYRLISPGLKSLGWQVVYMVSVVILNIRDELSWFLVYIFVHTMLMTFLC